MSCLGEIVKQISNLFPYFVFTPVLNIHSPCVQEWSQGKRVWHGRRQAAAVIAAAAEATTHRNATVESWPSFYGEFDNGWSNISSNSLNLVEGNIVGATAGVRPGRAILGELPWLGGRTPPAPRDTLPVKMPAALRGSRRLGSHQDVRYSQEVSQEEQSELAGLSAGRPEDKRPDIKTCGLLPLVAHIIV